MYAGIVFQETPGHPGVKGEKIGSEGHGVIPALNRFVIAVKHQCRRINVALCPADGFRVTGFFTEYAAVQMPAQSYEGDVGQRDCGVTRVDGAVVAIPQHSRFFGRIVKPGMRLEWRGDEHVRQTVLFAPEQTHGIAQVEPHGFAAPGDRGMYRGLRVGSQLSHEGRNGVGGGFIVANATNII